MSSGSPGRARVTASMFGLAVTHAHGSVAPWRWLGTLAQLSGVFGTKTRIQRWKGLELVGAVESLEGWGHLMRGARRGRMIRELISFAVVGSLMGGSVFVGPGPEHGEHAW